MESLIDKVYMSQETMDGLLEEDGGHEWVVAGFALGIHFVIDDDLPYRTVQLGYEDQEE